MQGKRSLHLTQIFVSKKAISYISQEETILLDSLTNLE